MGSSKFIESIIEFSRFKYDEKERPLCVLGKTTTSFLVGPILNGKVCRKCLYKRILSSVVYIQSDYLIINGKNKKDLLNFIKKASNKVINLLLRGDVILEYKKTIKNNYSKYIIHTVMPVPGCTSCYAKK